VHSTIGTFERQSDELWQRSLNAIGIKVEFVKQKFPEMLKKARAGQVQMWGLAKPTSPPRATAFLVSCTAGMPACPICRASTCPEFNRLYEQSRRLPDSPERTKLFREMSALVTAYAPWMLDVYRIENVVVYPWVQGYKYNPIDQHPWQYYDLDPARRRVTVQ
jgi:ABC-type transport system substrate-binding protein